jgi:predicted TPR repeat methyltransferase
MTDFAQPSSIALWNGLHKEGYHGDYASVLARNRISYKSSADRLCRFPFDPAGKVVIDIGCGGGWHMADCIANEAKMVYGVEIDQGIIEKATRSFQELEVPAEKYRFVCSATESLREVLPKADVIYSQAVFMHMPFGEVVDYLRLIAAKLNGTAYLQFYQKDGFTTFHAIATHHPVCLADSGVDATIEASGLQLVRKDYPRGPELEPVWTFYTCTTKSAS